MNSSWFSLPDIASQIEKIRTLSVCSLNMVITQEHVQLPSSNCYGNRKVSHWLALLGRDFRGSEVGPCQQDKLSGWLLTSHSIAIPSVKPLRRHNYWLRDSTLRGTIAMLFNFSKSYWNSAQDSSAGIQRNIHFSINGAPSLPFWISPWNFWKSSLLSSLCWPLLTSSLSKFWNALKGV